MRSDKFSYVAVSGFFIAISAYAFFKFIETGNYDLLKLSGTGLVPAILWVIWVASFKIELEEDRLTYTSLFQGTRTIRFEDILKANDQYAIDTQLNGLRRLNIWKKDDPKTPYIAINLKMFRGPDVKHLLDVLKPYKHANSPKPHERNDHAKISSSPFI